MLINKTGSERLLAIILICAVLLRFGVALHFGDTTPPEIDEYSYSNLAARLLEGHGYSFAENWYPFTPADTPTSHWSFLYTAFVAAIYSVVGYRPLFVRLAGAVLGGLLLPWLSYRLTRRVFPERERLSLLTAACVASYAFFILYSAMIMTETFYIAALLWSLERAIVLARTWQRGERVKWTLLSSFGVSIGLATLFRQAILPWVVILFVWLLGMGLRSRKGRRAFVALAPVGLIMLAFVLPFTLRNAQVYSDFLLLNSNAGYAMYSAQHPMHGIDFQAFEAAPLPDELLPVDSLTEAQWDRELMRRGIGFILADPGRYLLLSASRVLDYFEFWPTDTSLLHNVGRLVSFTLFLPFMLGGLLLSWRRELEQDSVVEVLATPMGLLTLFMVFYSLLHIFTWAMPRYRLPVDAVAMPFAALAIRESARALLARPVFHQLAGQLQSWVSG